MWTRFAVLSVVVVSVGCASPGPRASATRTTATFARVKAALDAVPAIDTHDHLWAFSRLTSADGARFGEAMNLHTLFRHSYYSLINPLSERKPEESFDAWWGRARQDFADARATSFYQYLLPAFQDLYGVDFNRITDAEARELDRKIVENYRDPRWLYHVITERANIELMLVDPYWAGFEYNPDYPFVTWAMNVNGLMGGFDPSQYGAPPGGPYRFAREHGLRLESPDDYVAVIDRIIADAKNRGAICLKQTLAYSRTLEFRNVSRERAAAAWGRSHKEVPVEQARDFEDWLMWRIVELAAKHDLPLQIHTGQARIQGSNPMLLVDLIESNPRTKFILFHGGFPWVGETGVIAMRHTSHVWVDSVWMPTLSYTMAKRAFHEWLEVMPADHILWGGDGTHPEAIYGATVFTRRCLAEVLAEKIDAGDLPEDQALRIGRQILRDNALKLFPSLKEKLWKHKGPLPVPVAHAG